jgi:hypothetical protein
MNNTYVKLTVIAVVMTGCAKKNTATMDPKVPANPQPQMNDSVPQRVTDLRRLSAQFNELAQRLPGRDENEHRAVMGDVFARLAEILPMLQGPDPSGAFRVQLRTIEDARQRLSAASSNLAMEPTIDSGLRAASSALSTITRETFYAGDNVSDEIDRLNAKLPELDSVHGQFHRLVVKDVVHHLAGIMGHMSEIYSYRLQQQNPAMSPSHAEPATAPATTTPPAL